ncbi:MAG: hypothetical protein HYX47_20620 [Burkholderiales bacterium]|nr:hypothetical protein [Burkholderiales bacterium]
MATTISSRRQLIVFILLGLALVGGAIRLLAPQPSVAHDIGNLLLVLWVPVIGNVVAFIIRRARRQMEPARDFAVNSPFHGHLLAELTPLVLPAGNAAQAAGALDGGLCVLAMGTDGFTARLPISMAEWLGSGEARTVQLELLRPALALPRFEHGRVFTVLAGKVAVGTGRVLQVLA